MNRQTVLDFWSDRRSAIAPLGALVLVFVIGFAALVLDMGHVYVVKNRLQATADATALAGVSQLPDEVAMAIKALEYAEKNMPAADYGTVLANADVIAGQWDPATRTFTPALVPLNAVQTTTRQESTSGNATPVFLGQVFGFTGYDLTASSIASVGAGADIIPEGCITATSPSEPDAFEILGTADITLTGCDLLVASSDPCAMSAKGTPTVTVEGDEGGGIYIGDEGGFCFTGGVVINPPPEQTSELIEDPYRYNPDPYKDVPPCDYTDATFTDSAIITPGVYCGGITWTGSGTATFQPGDYIIKDGPLDIGGNIAVAGRGTVSGNDLGVGFYLTGTNSVVNFKGTADIALKAPTSENTISNLQGFIFYEDPDNPPTQVHTLRGTSGGGYEGVLYFQGDVEMKGTADSGYGALTGDCTVLIADTIYLNGTTALSADATCKGFGGVPTGVGDLVLRLVD